MDRIDGANAAPGNLFQDADSGSGRKATSWTAEWANGVQEELIGGLIGKAGRVPAQGVYDQVFKSMIDLVYGIGDYIQSENDAVTPPQRYPWQTWVEVTGVTLIGRNVGQAEFNATGKTGGARTHTLVREELPNIQLGNGIVDDTGVSFVYGNTGRDVPGGATQTVAADTGGQPKNFQGLTEALGDGESFSILPPYRVVRMWRRTA